MKKIKNLTIALLVLSGIFVTLQNYITAKLMLSFMLVNLCLFIFLNIQAFKIKGVVKKLTLYIDVLLVIMICSVFLPIEGRASYLTANLSLDFILLVIAGLLIAILVNVYKEENNLIN